RGLDHHFPGAADCALRMDLGRCRLGIARSGDEIEAVAGIFDDRLADIRFRKLAVGIVELIEDSHPLGVIRDRHEIERPGAASLNPAAGGNMLLALELVRRYDDGFAFSEPVSYVGQYL